MNDDVNGPIFYVEPGDPRNDQMLAQTRQEFRSLLDITIFPLIEQAEVQNVDLAAMMAVLVNSWLVNEDYMPRHRLASLLALAMVKIAEEELKATVDKTKM